MRKFDLKAIQEKHPAEYAAVFEAGRAAERDRVAALLHAGSVSGAMDLAHATIASGGDLDAKLSAQFLERGMMTRMKNDRAEDEREVSLAADGAASTNIEAGKSPADVVADMFVADLKSGKVDRDVSGASIRGVRL